MNIRKHIFIWVSLVISTAPITSHALCAAAKDLNGVWQSNDGGTYSVRHINNEVWWVGKSNDNGKTWTNVFKGAKNGNTVIGQWVDVPSGKNLSGGVLHLNIQGNGGVSGFTRSHATGGFGGSEWFKPCNDVILNPVK